MFSERQYLSAANDKVVRHMDINELECLLQTLRDSFISRAGLGVSTEWSVMRK